MAYAAGLRLHRHVNIRCVSVILLFSPQLLCACEQLDGVVGASSDRHAQMRSQYLGNVWIQFHVSELQCHRRRIYCVVCSELLVAKLGVLVEGIEGIATAC